MLIFWIFALIAVMIAAYILYSRRYTGTKKIWGLYSIQFFNLFIGTPVVLVAIINIALEIISREEVQHVPAPATFLFTGLALSIITTAVGNAIHSTSTSVSEAFQKGARTKAYFTNEVFHRYISHELGSLGAIGIALFIGLLELNHPVRIPEFSPEAAIISGVIFGVLISSYIIRGTFIGLSLLVSLWASAVLFFEMYSLYSSAQIEHYPISITMLALLVTESAVLLTVALIVLFSKPLTHRLVKLLFPKGHPVRESFHM